ncbi:hypothetical protein ALC57_00729 [Trachymyrmex cornetzi]|uniref:Uncharacterized protein n=1 Tax=Trachymyrmex cornetzi TaxID=471704 RepID=A0A151JR68_9HYME|nr:hypothetical protein ALC57_00729 [Trachymyrmex cornetzi]
MPRDAGSLEQAVRGHGRCCRRRSHRKETPKLQESSVQRSTKSQNSAHTLIASLKECLCLSSSFLKPFFSVTRSRSSSIAISRSWWTRASERAHEARSFPSTLPRKYRVAIARDERHDRNTHFRMRDRMPIDSRFERSTKFESSSEHRRSRAYRVKLSARRACTRGTLSELASLRNGLPIGGPDRRNVRRVLAVSAFGLRVPDRDSRGTRF